MKRTDLAMIILIASLSIMVSYFVANSLPIFQDSTKPKTVKTADKITSKVTEPDVKIFNSNAINPTIKIVIGAGDKAE